MTDVKIALATPHSRYDALETAVRGRGSIKVLRIREQHALNVQALQAFAPDYVFFPHWSWRVAPEIFERFECVIFHMTDLPYGRGGSPLQNLVLRGVERTVLTALKCTAELDAGPIYDKQPLSTLGTAEEVFLRAASLMEPMIVRIVTDRVPPVPQVGEAVQFVRRRPSESDLSGAATLERVHDMIRMLDADGYPNAFVQIGDLRFEFSRSSLKSDHILADVRITCAGGESSS